MDVKLIVANGTNVGQKIAVTGPKFFIGRSEECQLRPRSDLVSRHHCAIVLEEGYVGVRDFGSKNGTLVNGEAVRGERELKNGDRLTIGQLEFEVELAVSVSGKKKPKVHSIQEAAARMVESAGDDELDLGNWLAEGETSPGGSAHADTQTLTGAAAAEAAAASRKAADEAEKREEEKRVDAAAAWKGAPTKKPDSGSSRDAAANVLKNFFNRR